MMTKTVKGRADDAFASVLNRKRKESQLVAVLRRLSKNKMAMLGLFIFLIEVLLAISAQWIMPYDYAQINPREMLQAPSLAHLMGTDDMGRDIFSRLLYGARYSLGIGIVSLALGAWLGIIIGAIAGYAGGWVDNLIMRFLDIIQAIPGMLLMIAIAAVLGNGFFNTCVALAVGGIPGTARLLRASILNIRNMEYLEAAESINCSKFRLISGHILPNAFSPLIVSFAMGVANSVVSAASLSFIGLGIQPPTPEWGAMLSAGRAYIRDYPHLELFPGIAIMITVLALNLLGDGLRDALDPKLKD